MKSNGNLGDKWLKMAEDDLVGAELWINAGRPLAGACFHCQQAAEKALKAWLMAHDRAAPKTHQVEELVALCTEIQPLFASFAADAKALTEYAVEKRYDADFWPSLDQAQTAFGRAKRIYDFVKAHWK
jgi:HEPN domain-containing protein